MTYGVLSAAQLRATVGSITAAQRPDGAIPWFAGGHVDPWDHVEAAMALDVGRRHAEAERAYEWLRAQQAEDGSWAAAYRDGRVVDATKDANFCAYVAVGAWHHLLATDDTVFAQRMWPTVQRAVDFVLGLQAATGEIAWARDPHDNVWPEALLTSSSCIYLSLRCAIGLADLFGEDRPDWELSAGWLAHAIARRPEQFSPRQRWSMDWYYPVLGGAVRGDAARARIAEGWDTFVVDGRGIRCVSDRPWVTGAETCELVLALHAMGEECVAAELFAWMQHLRTEDGGYWTGWVFPDDVFWPEEQSTWTAGAVVLAADALAGSSATAGLFRGDLLPDVVDPSPTLSDPEPAS